MRSKKYSWSLKAYLSLHLLALLFNQLHWPYVYYIEFTAILFLITIYPLRYQNKKIKTFLDYIKMLIVLIISVSFFFELDSYFLTIFLSILFIYWFFKEGLLYLKLNLLGKNKSTKKKVVDWIIFLGIMLIIFGSFIFKLQHWPYNQELQILGYTLLIVSIWFKNFDNKLV